MKNIIKILLVSAILVAIPFVTVTFFNNSKKKETKQITKTIPVYVVSEDKVINMDINQYLKEVVAAEMPAEFHEEALRAQAIAARTYLVNRMDKNTVESNSDYHKGAYICTDSTHCKAWISEKKIKQKWGNKKSSEYWKKISDSVDSTSELIITYKNKPISAVFHSTSSGNTENAKDVWGGEVEYLVSVKSEGDINSPKFLSEVEMSFDEFKKIAYENIEGVDFSEYLIGNIERSEAGGIISIDVGKIKVKGTDFRFMYGLHSTNIEIIFNNNKIKMSVKGYGHCVGMSQYGANYLASIGKNYEEILKTYYTGVEISEYSQIK